MDQRKIRCAMFEQRADECFRHTRTTESADQDRRPIGYITDRVNCAIAYFVNHDPLPRCCERSYPLQDQGNALPYADAHGAQGIPSVAPVQLIDCGHCQSGAGSAQRMAQGYRTAIWIDM